MDFDFWDLVVKSASLLVAFSALAATVVGIWWNNQQTDRRLREQDVREDVTAIRSDVGRAFSRIDGLGQRVATNEQTLKHVPSQESINQLQLSVEKMSGRLDTMAKELHGEISTMQTAMESIEKLSNRLQHQVDQMDQWLRNNGGGRG